MGNECFLLILHMWYDGAQFGRVVTLILHGSSVAVAFVSDFIVFIQLSSVEEKVDVTFSIAN